MNPHGIRVTPQPSHCVFRALRNSPDFSQARVVDGSIEWPGETDLSYDTLYLRSVAVKQVTPA